MGEDISIQAVDVSDGTKPVGSTWRRNPVPMCNCDDGEDCSTTRQLGSQSYRFATEEVADQIPFDDKPYGKQELPDWYQKDYDHFWLSHCDSGFQFQPPAEGVFAAGISFSIGDLLKVPEIDGDFILQWRWDCEQTPQIWSSCADIRIIGAADVKAMV